jgi:hypothetical protein
MRARFFIFVALFLIILGFSACSPSSGGKDSSLWDGNFSSSAPSGSINGKSFVFASGFVESYASDPNYWYEFFNVSTPVGVYPIYSTGTPYLHVFFKLSKATGSYPLYWDQNSGANMRVTLYDPAYGTSGINYWCTDGEIRIDTIDTVGKTISGVVAAYDSSGNYVNGTFTLPIKP